MKRILIFTTLILSIIIFSSCIDNTIYSNFPTRNFVFPKDMAPHRHYNTEWWYQTGYLYTDTDTSTPTFGYEFTLFRSYQPSNKRWPKFLGISMGEIWDVQLSIENFKTKKRVFVDRPILPNMLLFPPVATKNNTLYLQGNYNPDFLLYGDEKKMYLKIKYNDIKINFTINAEKKPVLNNANGIVTMDKAKSYYYSITRLKVNGNMTFGDNYKVHGETWFDQQWGNMEDIPPWDWFSLRLDNNEELMIFRFPDDGKAYATYVKSNNKAEYFDDVEIKLLNSVKIKNKNVPIPMPGKIEIPSLQASFTLNALDRDQINITKYTPSYWEGLCKVKGIIDDKNIDGYAYFEGWR